MLSRGTCVVAQAGERKIGAKCIEQRQRRIAIPPDTKQPVGDFVTDISQFSRGEMAGKFARTCGSQFQIGRTVEHIREWNFLTAATDGNFKFILFNQKIELLTNIVGKHLRLCKGGTISSDLFQFAEGKICYSFPLFTTIGDDQFGIAEIKALAIFCARRYARFTIMRQGVLEAFDRAFILGNKLLDNVV